MAGSRYNFEFTSPESFDEATSTLLVASLAAEGVFGAAQVQMDLEHGFDPPTRSLWIDAGTEVGASVVRIFTTLATAELGKNAFRVSRVPVASLVASAV